MNPNFLDFEQPIAELEAKISELRHASHGQAMNIEEEINRLKDKCKAKTEQIFANLSPWQISQLARHPQRPQTLDYIETIFRFDEKLRRVNLRFSDQQRDELLKLHALVKRYIEGVNLAYKDANPDAVTKLDPVSKQIRKLIKQIRNEHLADISSVDIAPQITVAHLNALNAYGRVRDHGQNVAEVVAGEK